jgi:hypothetical protein
MKKIFFLLLILFFTLILINAQDYAKQIDKIVADKNLADLKKYLEANQKNADYKKIEDYTIVKVKSLISEKSYDWAKQILEAVLNFNLDNQEAQDIYISIEQLGKDKTIIEQKQKEKEIENQIKKEKKEFEESKKVSFKNFLFQAEFGAIDFTYYQSGFYNEFYNAQKNNFKYGLSSQLGFYFVHPYAATGLDVYFDSYFADVYPSSGIQISYKILLGVTTPLMKVPFYLRVGFGQIIYYFNKNTTIDIFAQNIYSPLIGFRVKDFYFNKFIGINGSFDFYLISFFTSYFDAAFDVNLGILYRFYSYKDMKFYIRSEVFAYFLVGYKKLENNIKLQISAGISLNEK